MGLVSRSCYLLVIGPRYSYFLLGSLSTLGRTGDGSEKSQARGKDAGGETCQSQAGGNDAAINSEEGGKKDSQ